MALQLYEVPIDSSINTSTNLKKTELSCETEKLYLDFTLKPSKPPSNDVYEEITEYTTADGNTTDHPIVNCETENLYIDLTLNHSKPDNMDVYEDPIDVGTTANPLDVNTTANPLDVNTTANPLDVGTTDNPLDVNTTDNPLDVNPCAVTLPVNNENAEPEPPCRRKRTLKWLIGAVTVTGCVGVIVWIASEMNWTRKEVDISPITTNTTIHPASEINWNRKEVDISRKHGKDKNYLQAVRQDRFIGFTAWAESRIDHKETIRFTGVQVNEGGLYSTATGQFSCNVTGVYYIAVTLKRTADVNDVMDITIYKGDERLLETRDPWEQNVGMSITNSRLVVCLSGERLSMRGAFDGGPKYQQSVAQHSTFTAFLLQETETSSKKHGSFVGFTAAINTLEFYDSGETIEFSKVIYNDGGHFNPATNSFSCPFPGIYYVSVAIDKYTLTHVCVSKSTKPFLHIDDSHREFSTSSNTAVIRCQQNETMIIKGTWEGKKALGPDQGSTFTVMLLQADATLRNASLVAFSIYKKTSQSYRVGDTISFGGVIMNEGNYFVADQFVCLNSGIFYISLNAKKSGGKPLSLDVKVQMVTVMHLESIEVKNTGITTSGSVLTRCGSNEVIQVTAAAGGEVYGHQVERHTTFSVIMMYHN